MTRQPPAIKAAADKIVAAVASARFSGIVGQQSPDYTPFGYHQSRDRLLDVNTHDGSIHHPRDQGGNGENASALDISMDSMRMKTVTKRLRDAVVRSDPRLSGLAEFAGTLDGQTVYAFDLKDGERESWDRSHLWHVHLSGFRDVSDSFEAWDKIADVFIGAPLSNGGGGSDGGLPDGGGQEDEDDDMTPEEHGMLVNIQERLGDTVYATKNWVEEIKNKLDAIGIVEFPAEGWQAETDKIIGQNRIDIRAGNAKTEENLARTAALETKVDALAAQAQAILDLLQSRAEGTV